MQYEFAPFVDHGFHCEVSNRVGGTHGQLEISVPHTAVEVVIEGSGYMVRESPSRVSREVPASRFGLLPFMIQRFPRQLV
ncbi:hypothetical protein FHW23_000192 [Curtobacterium pusillum]|uniref:Uncharacterized protein n=1 Tax=Curtobacterium pusillum TaxID=69373 RepID=A0AAW3T2F6_9MICO|nr:hypothetical protein [Curtobacterium pusillum]MBA8988960.1 hypothetical protein [Curtobacterium pusillum]